MGTYTVKRGDNLSKIAQMYGLRTWKDLYNHPDNAAFKRSHPNPNLIYPGDVLKVPDSPPVLPPSRVPAGAQTVHPDLRIFTIPMENTEADKCCTLATPVECSYTGHKRNYTCPEGFVKLSWPCMEGTRQVGCGECSKAPASNCFQGPWLCSIWWWES